MDFLKKMKSHDIEIVKTLRATVQCATDSCTFWGKMDGGTTKENETTGVFICPDCGGVNYVKWNIDG